MPWLPKKHQPFKGKSHGSALQGKRKREVQRKTYFGKQNLYKTQRWLRLRKMLIGAQPVCAVVACNHLTTDVDHVVPHCGDEALFYAFDNLQGLSKSCHARKTAKEDGGFGNRKK